MCKLQLSIAKLSAKMRQTVYHIQKSISVVYFLSEKLKISPVFPPLENPRHVLVFKQSMGSTEPMTATLGQGGGDSEKMLSKLPKLKSKPTFAGLKGSEF